MCYSYREWDIIVVGLISSNLSLMTGCLVSSYVVCCLIILPLNLSDLHGDFVLNVCMVTPFKIFLNTSVILFFPSLSHLFILLSLPLPLSPPLPLPTSPLPPHLAGEDFNIIQQEIQILSDCKNHNIVGYYGSYLRYNGKVYWSMTCT